MPQTTHKNAHNSNKAKAARNRTGASASRESIRSKRGKSPVKTGNGGPVIRDRIKSLRPVRAGDLIPPAAELATASGAAAAGGAGRPEQDRLGRRGE